jgi:hypothetical protein
MAGPPVLALPVVAAPPVDVFAAEAAAPVAVLVLLAAPVAWLLPADAAAPAPPVAPPPLPLFVLAAELLDEPLLPPLEVPLVPPLAAPAAPPVFTEVAA